MPSLRRSNAPTDAPSPRGFVILGLLAVATLLVITTETLPVGLLPQIARGLHVSAGRVGLLVTVYGAVVVVGAVPLSALIARFPPRWSMTVVLAVFVASMLGTAASTTLGAAVAARLLGGVAHAVFTSCSFAMAVSVVPPVWRGRAVAITGAGNAVALALGVPAATTLGAQLGWRVPFQLAAAALFAVLVAIVVLHRPSATAGAPEASSARSLLAAAKDPALVRVAVVIVLVMGAHFLTYTYVAPILIGAGVPEASVGLVLIGYGVAGAVGLLVAGRIADRRPRGILIVTIAVTAAALALLWLLRGSAPGAIAATAVWGSAFGAAPVLWQLIAVRAAPASASVGPAVVNSAFNVGISLGALGGGSLLALVPASALALPSVALLAVALVLATRPRWLPADSRTNR